MTAEEFKIAWRPDEEFFQWTEFPPEELAKTDLSGQTKSFLAYGFPEDAAPFLSFGLRSHDWKLYNMDNVPYYSHHELGATAKNYWLIGSDGSGNPICLDTGNAERIVLLDHESGFELMDTMNASIIELAQSLLAYRGFIEQVNEEYGEDGFFDSKYTRAQVEELKRTFTEINPNIFNESSFWEQEVNMLSEEASS